MNFVNKIYVESFLYNILAFVYAKYSAFHATMLNVGHLNIVHTYVCLP